jgi:hypothetical protein
MDFLWNNENMNMEGVWKLQFIFSFMHTTHKPLQFVRKMKFKTVKYHGHTYKFIWIIILFDEASKYGDFEKFWGYVGTNAE